MDEAQVERRLAAILVADIAEYGRLIVADEAATVAALKGHQAVVLPMAFSLQASALARLGREAEVRAALAILQQLQSGITLTRIKENWLSDNPEYNRLIERYYDGLRKAGLPE